MLAIVNLVVGLVLLAGDPYRVYVESSSSQNMLELQYSGAADNEVRIARHEFQFDQPTYGIDVNGVTVCSSDLACTYQWYGVEGAAVVVRFWYVGSPSAGFDYAIRGRDVTCANCNPWLLEPHWSRLPEMAPGALTQDALLGMYEQLAGPTTAIGGTVMFIIAIWLLTKFLNFTRSFGHSLANMKHDEKSSLPGQEKKSRDPYKERSAE